MPDISTPNNRTTIIAASLVGINITSLSMANSIYRAAIHASQGVLK